MSALVIVRLASALEAVGAFAGQAVHDVEVIGAGASCAVTELRKIAGVGRLSARRSSNHDLRQKPEHTSQIFHLDLVQL